MACETLGELMDQWANRVIDCELNMDALSKRVSALERAALPAADGQASRTCCVDPPVAGEFRQWLQFERDHWNQLCVEAWDTYRHANKVIFDYVIEHFDTYQRAKAVAPDGRGAAPDGTARG